MRPYPPQKPNISRFHKLLGDLAIDRTLLYQELSINPAHMEASNTSISMLKYSRLLELAAKRSNNRFLGIDMARLSTDESLGALGYMMRNASNFEQSLVLLRRYITLVSPSASIRLIRQNTQCILTYKIRGISPSDCCQCVEMTIAQFVFMFQAALESKPWLPQKIYFEHAPVIDNISQNFPFKTELIFNHSFSGISFSEDLLEYPILNHDPQLLALLESQVQQTLPNHSYDDSLIEHIRLFISANVGHRRINSDIAASELGMSRSTLSRRLSEIGSTFNSLRENIILELAKEQLCTTLISISELAQNLGYSDSSSFNRAFKRLMGINPLAYRKTQTGSA